MKLYAVLVPSYTSSIPAGEEIWPKSIFDRICNTKIINISIIIGRRRRKKKRRRRMRRRRRDKLKLIQKKMETKPHECKFISCKLQLGKYTYIHTHTHTHLPCT